MTGAGTQDASVLKAAVADVLSPTQSLQAAKLQSTRVLLRADLNCPLSKSKSVSDDSRITGSLPTIQLLQSKRARIVLVSHLGRPSPKSQTLVEMKERYSLRPVADRLSALLGPSFVGLVDECVGGAVQEAVAKLQDGQVLLLENTRFHAGETANDPHFSAQLAELADVYVNDAFGVVHRAQASVTGVAPLFPRRFAGLLLLRELEYLTNHIWNPVRPLGVALGGAKVADKIGVLWALIEIADKIVIGGRMAFTFLAAMGVAVGQTQIESSWLQPAREMMAKAAERGVELVLPQDVVVTESLEGGHPVTLVPLTRTCCTKDAPCIPPGCFGADIGPASAEQFEATLKSCRTIFWNGPMGKFEVEEFAAGTRHVAKAIAACTAQGAITVVGGGDSVAAVHSLGLLERFSHVSTGGGASLELIEGRSMPGIEALAFSPSFH